MISRNLGVLVEACMSYHSSAAAEKNIKWFCSTLEYLKNKSTILSLKKDSQRHWVKKSSFPIRLLVKQIQVPNLELNENITLIAIPSRGNFGGNPRSAKIMQRLGRCTLRKKIGRIKIWRKALQKSVILANGKTFYRMWNPFIKIKFIHCHIFIRE